jgi:hypothetical protein
MNFESEISVIVLLIVLFIIIGLFGNIISIIIFNDKEFRKQPPAFYLIVTSIVNIVTLFYLPILVLPNIWMINSMSCKFFAGLTLTLTEIQSFIVAICSMDRLITVFTPFKCLFKNKMKFQIPLVAIVSSVIVCLVIPAAYFYDKDTTSDNQTFCAFSNEHHISWAFNYFKIQFILFRIGIPFLLMILSSGLIYWKITSNKRKLGTLNASQKQAYQLGITLVVTDILFVVFRLPTLVYVTMNLNEVDKIVYSFNYSMFALIPSLHYSFNFLIFIFFNKVYRQLFIVFTKKIFKKQNQVGNFQ